MRYAALFLFILVVFSSASYAQWSTSTRAESTLYVCPGFYPGIVSFDDGSSIVLGALQSYIFARKLDEYGYYQWPAVQVHYNDSSYVTDVFPYGDWGGWISDGDGGVILFWYDRRGAYDTGMDWANSAIYVQRVDKFGTVRWTPGGVLVKGPATGRKKGGVVNDGQGGCVIAWVESEFGFPGAHNRERTRVVRVSSNGQLMWERSLDSSNTQYSLVFRSVVRAQDRLFFQSTAGTRILLLDGTVFTEIPIGGFGFLVSERDSVLYNAIQIDNNTILQIKLTSQLDTIWTAFSSGGGGSATLLFNPAVPDGHGGIYYLRSRNDNGIYVKIRRVDSRGEVWGSELIVQNTSIPTGGYDGHGGVLVGDWNARVWRFDSLAQPIWPTNPVTLLSDPSNAYFPRLAADNKGGMIMVFWTTRGGIYAQHSGRAGQIGIITSINDAAQLPASFKLEQNNPNPFNPSTEILFEIGQDGWTSLKVYDLLGREIAELVNEFRRAGRHKVHWSANNAPSGIYFYRLQTPNFVSSKKMVFLR